MDGKPPVTPRVRTKDIKPGWES